MLMTGKPESRPIYQKIFEYLQKNYESVYLYTPLRDYYLEEIYGNVYEHMDGPVNPEQRSFQSPGQAASILREFAWASGTPLMGFTRVKEEFVFQGVDIEHEYAVVIGMEMDFDLIEKAPELEAGLEALRVYWRLGQAANMVAGFIRFLGYPARAHHPRTFVGYPPTILNPLAAVSAGLGEIGRQGLLITEEFGPRVRLATVTTDLPLPQAEPKRFGVEEFCEGCTLCREACKGDAIPDHKAEVRGIMKYTIDPYKCLPEFAKTDGCALCISKCAFNKRSRELEKFVQKTKKLLGLLG
jgi:epoxyqueuosine reductase